MAKIVNTEYTFLDFKSMGLNEATKNPNVITIIQYIQYIILIPILLYLPISKRQLVAC